MHVNSPITAKQGVAEPPQEPSFVQPSASEHCELVSNEHGVEAPTQVPLPMVPAEPARPPADGAPPVASVPPAPCRRCAPRARAGLHDVGHAVEQDGRGGSR